MKRLLLAIFLIISIYSCGSTTKNQKWKVSYFVDEFGDSTTDKYVTTEKYIWGKFSNSATDNSKLKVKFLITKTGHSKDVLLGTKKVTVFDESFNIGINLYEYGSLKVKALSYEYPISYIITIKHNDTPTDQFWCGENSSERMNIENCPDYYKKNSALKNAQDSATFINYLTKGGKLKIFITESGGNGSYGFELNTDALDLLTALKQL